MDCCSVAHWGWWQWTQYWFGRGVCDINCGGCVCVSGTGGLRGLTSVSTVERPTHDEKGRTINYIDNPDDTRLKYLDQSVATRTRQFVWHALMRRPVR